MDGLGIGIAGAGMGGLAAASLLADRGHRVTLFDQFDAPRPVGSGLVVQPVGLEVLHEIGAAARAQELGAPIARMRGLEAGSGRPVLDVTYGREPGLALHRSALFAALLEAAARRRIDLRTGSLVTGRDGQRFAFADGSRSEAFDLLVDASGARSALSPLRARSLAYGALWGVVDWVPEAGLDPGHLSQRYRRADRMLGVLPIGRLPGDRIPKAAIFWSLRADGHQGWRDRGVAAWAEEAAALWPEAAPFFGQIDHPDRLTMARYSHGTLRRPHAPGLAILGDAAHRASPQLGQGANMALLDALALARALDHFPGREALPDALRAYGAARRWHIRSYQALSAAFTPQYQGDSRWLPILRDRVLYPLSCLPPLPRILSALVSGHLIPPLGSLGAAAPRPDLRLAALLRNQAV
jgi:2-polyprenyl-6-methoxyphenol hydroxylase-like FAD-dependent oxidoreductase